MLGEAAKRYDPQSIKQIMQDIGADGQADDPDLRSFFSRVAQIATEALR